MLYCLKSDPDLHMSSCLIIGTSITEERLHANLDHLYLNIYLYL